MSAKWQNVMKGQGQGDSKGSRTSTSGSKEKGKGKGKAKRYPKTGRFKPRHGTYMVNSSDPADGPETQNAQNCWQQDHYHFLAGEGGGAVFAWPKSATPTIANLMLTNPQALPPGWVNGFPAPMANCQACTTTIASQPWMADQCQGDQEPGWFWACQL